MRICSWWASKLFCPCYCYHPFCGAHFADLTLIHPSFFTCHCLSFETVLLCDTVVIVLIPFLVANKQQRSTQKLNFEQFQHFTWIRLGTTGETCLFNPTHCLPLVWSVFFCLVSSCSTYPAFATRQRPFHLLQDLVRCVSVKRWQKLRFGNHVTLKDLWKCSWVWSSKATKGEKKNPPISAFSPSHLLNLLNILILPYMCTMQTMHLMYSNVYSSNNVSFLPCIVF